MRARNESFSLVGCGASGHWNVDLVESADGARWSLELDGPRFSMAFELDDPKVVTTALKYLRSPAGSSEPLLLGHFGSAPVALRWDDEGSDRCFLVAGPSDNSILHLNLSAEDTRMLAEALEQVIEDLPESTVRPASA